MPFKLVYVLNLLLTLKLLIYYKFFEIVGSCPSSINGIVIPILFLVLTEVASSN